MTTFRAIEYIVYVDGSLLESELFHFGREAQYPAAIEARIKRFTDGGWVKMPIDEPGLTEIIVVSIAAPFRSRIRVTRREDRLGDHDR